MTPEDFLENNGIKYVLHEHPAVYTCEEAERLCAHVSGVGCKNMLLKDKKGTTFVLLVTLAEKRVDLKRFAEIVGVNKVTFASPDELKEKLNLEPGAVSPFGLLNNANGDVELYVDKEVCNADIVSLHPNRNTASIELSKEMFEKFLISLKKVHKIDL